MAGEVKRKYGKYLCIFSKHLTHCINKIIPLLREGYTKNILLELFKKYYPFEWQQINEMYDYYRKRDCFLKLHGKKERYKFPVPKEYFFAHPKVRFILSEGFRLKLKSTFSEKAYNTYLTEFSSKRNSVIIKRKKRIEEIKAVKKDLEPHFLDAYITLYRKSKDIGERIELLREIQKYDCEKSIAFLYCVNDGSSNNQLRQEAFKILQETGHFVVLRKNFKGKKRPFYTESFDYKNWKPEDLLLRLKEKKSIQKKKI